MVENTFEHINRDFGVSYGKRYGVDTSLQSVTCTLPTDVRPGFSVFFADWSGTFGEHNLVIKSSGKHTINGSATSLVVDTAGDSIGLFWTGTTWRTYE